MKAIYDIRNKKGVHLCYQVARDAGDSLSLAKTHGARGVKTAEFVRHQ